MVRRWSYITNTNRHEDTAAKIVLRASFDINMNTTMYLRRLYAVSTKLPRRRWARRKHVHSWVHLTNILRNWASTYRFYRNLNKSIFTQHFFKNTLIAFNLVSHRNSLPCLYNGAELVVTSKITKRVLRYYEWCSNPKLTLFRTYKYASLALMSYNPAYNPSTLWEPNMYLTPLVQSHVDHAELNDSVSDVALSTRTTAHLVFTNLLSLAFRIYLLSLKLLYKNLVMLSFLRIKCLYFCF
jgi:hypothetical protein